MNRAQRRRLALLVASACLVGALTAAVALGAARRQHERPLGADAGSFRMTLPDAVGGTTLSWSARRSDDDIIVVAGTKCPKSHPHKVGSSSAGSWTQVNGGPVRHTSHRRTYCAR